MAYRTAIKTMSVAAACLLGLIGCKKHSSTSSTSPSPSAYIRQLHYSRYNVDKKNDTVINSTYSFIDSLRKDSAVAFTPQGDWLQFMLCGYVFAINKNNTDTVQYYPKSTITPSESVSLTYYRLRDSIYFSDALNRVTKNGGTIETFNYRTEWSGVIK